MDRKESFALTLECLLIKVEEIRKTSVDNHHSNNCLRHESSVYAKINK